MPEAWGTGSVSQAGLDQPKIARDVLGEPSFFDFSIGGGKADTNRPGFHDLLKTLYLYGSLASLSAFPNQRILRALGEGQERMSELIGLTVKNPQRFLLGNLPGSDQESGFFGSFRCKGFLGCGIFTHRKKRRGTEKSQFKLGLVLLTRIFKIIELHIGVRTEGFYNGCKVRGEVQVLLQVLKNQGVFAGFYIAFPSGEDIAWNRIGKNGKVISLANVFWNQYGTASCSIQGNLNGKERAAKFKPYRVFEIENQCRLGTGGFEGQPTFRLVLVEIGENGMIGPYPIEFFLPKP